MELNAQWSIRIAGRNIGLTNNTYIIAELSANHNQDYDQAVKLMEAAKEAGADAIKLQTYTPDTLTIDCDNKYFRIGKGTIWEGKTLYQLYQEAYTPWDWQPKLKERANEMGLDLFSTAYDDTAVDFLETMDIPAYKIASFEIVDLPLLRRIAKTGKPIILSTGMATLAEIEEAVRTIRETGNRQLALLKCTSAYPAPPEEMNLRSIPRLAESFNVIPGLSDHTLGTEVAIAAVVLGACIIEKHFTLSRQVAGPDSAFSMEPDEFRGMVDAIRTVEKALGKEHYRAGAEESKNLIFRRSLFVVKDVKAGESFTNENVRSIRPGYGLAPKHLAEILGCKARCDLIRGTPLDWKHVQKGG